MGKWVTILLRQYIRHRKIFFYKKNLTQTACSPSGVFLIFFFIFRIPVSKWSKNVKFPPCTQEIESAFTSRYFENKINSWKWRKCDLNVIKYRKSVAVYMGVYEKQTQIFSEMEAGKRIVFNFLGSLNRRYEIF